MRNPLPLIKKLVNIKPVYSLLVYCELWYTQGTPSIVRLIYTHFCSVNNATLDANYKSKIQFSTHFLKAKGGNSLGAIRAQNLL